LLIKYIKSVLWRVAKCLSYIEEARCLKVKELIAFSLLTHFCYALISNICTSFLKNFMCHCLRSILLFGFFKVLYILNYTFEGFHIFTLYVYFTL